MNATTQNKPCRCPHCGTLLHELDVGAPTASPDEPRATSRDPLALERLKPKLIALGDVIDDMGEDEFGVWLNQLPFPEFLEFIILDNAGIAAIMNSDHSDCRHAA